MYSTTGPLMPMSSRMNAPAMFDQPSHCHWRPLILIPVSPNRFTTPMSKRQRGGIEPLHVSMPRELKSRASTSTTHFGLATNRLTKMEICVLQFPILCKPMPGSPAYRPPPPTIEVGTSPACKPTTCPQFCRLHASAIKLNTSSTRDMRSLCPNNVIWQNLKNNLPKWSHAGLNRGPYGYQPYDLTK
jgi:hypothetical protein